MTPFTADTVFEPFSPLSLNFDFASLFRDIESLPALKSSNGNAIRRSGSALGRKRPELKPTSGGVAEVCLSFFLSLSARDSRNSRSPRPQTVSHPPLPTEFFDYSSLLREIEAYPQTRRPREDHPPPPVQTTVDTALLMQSSNDPSSPTMNSFDTTWISPAPDGRQQRQSDNAHQHQDAATAALFPPDFDINQLLREIEEYPIRKHGQSGPSSSSSETVQNHPKSFVSQPLSSCECRGLSRCFFYADDRAPRLLTAALHAGRHRLLRRPARAAPRDTRGRSTLAAPSRAETHFQRGGGLVGTSSRRGRCNVILHRRAVA